MTKIDELIEECEDQIKRCKQFSQSKEYFAKVLITYQIALAYLELHKQGYVLVPSEPTEEMVIATGVRTDTSKSQLIHAIKERPVTDLDTLMERV